MVLTYGNGELFQGAATTLGNELLRAGAHGLASGVVSALDGGNFASAFVSGAAASGIGSYAQGINMNSGLMVASTTVMGGAVAWATGGDFLQGAMQGMNIGFLNHAMHDDRNILGGSATCEVLPDGTLAAQEYLDEVKVTGQRRLKLPNVPIEKPLEPVSPEFGILLAGRAVVNGLAGVVMDGINSIYRYSIWQNKTVQFGNNPNQLYHAFRHVDDMGLNRNIVRRTILDDLKSLDDIPVGKAINRGIDVSGSRVQYTVFKRLKNGKYIYNIGRIHGK